MKTKRKADKFVSFRVDGATLARINQLAGQVGSRSRLIMLALGLADGLITMDDLITNGGATSADERVQRVRADVIGIVEALAPGLPSIATVTTDETPLT